VSNFLAVATVTAALQLHLYDTVRAAVSGAEVWVDRSDVKRTQPGVNIYLYRSTPDPALRNQDLPARRPDASLVERARTAQTLHYLLTYHGKDDDLVPQRLLGATLAALHTRPALTRDLFERVVAEAVENPPSHPYLATSDLPDAEEVVRLGPEELDLDELSKLWSVFFQSPYQLSTTCTASPVLLEEQDGLPLPAPPVLERGLAVGPLLRPRVRAVHDAADPRGPVVGTSVLQITGSGLHGEGMTVRVGASEIVPLEGGTASTVRVALSGATGLRPGTEPVLVQHRWLVGDPAEPRRAEVSNAVAVLVSPTVTASVSAGSLTVVSDLPVGVRQRAAVSLLAPADGTTARLLDVPARDQETTSLTVLLPDLPAGPYAVRLHVDGAASPLTRDASGTVTAPVVIVP
jgi:hypothetical protein